MSTIAKVDFGRGEIGFINTVTNQMPFSERCSKVYFYNDTVAAVMWSEQIFLLNFDTQQKTKYEKCYEQYHDGGRTGFFLLTRTDGLIDVFNGAGKLLISGCSFADNPKPYVYKIIHVEIDGKTKFVSLKGEITFECDELLESRSKSKPTQAKIGHRLAYITERAHKLAGMDFDSIIHHQVSLPYAQRTHLVGMVGKQRYLVTYEGDVYEVPTDIYTYELSYSENMFIYKFIYDKASRVLSLSRYEQDGQSPFGELKCKTLPVFNGLPYAVVKHDGDGWVLIDENLQIVLGPYHNIEYYGSKKDFAVVMLEDRSKMLYQISKRKNLTSWLTPEMLEMLH